MTLTREEILAKEQGPELDKLIAEHVMGWSIYRYDKDVPERCYYMLVDKSFDPVVDGGYWNAGERKTEEEAWKDNRPFSTNISAAWEVEEQIKELRLHAAYVSALKQVLISTGEYVGMFDYIHATAEQRCKAALLAVLNL